MPQQTAFEMVSLEGLVPKDHLLRKIEAVIDFSFIHDRVAGLYCPDNGRPPLDPTLMFKALFVGYLFGIRSERQLLREIEVNVAYRWFLGLQLTEPVFDASTLSPPPPPPFKAAQTGGHALLKVGQWRARGRQLFKSRSWQLRSDEDRAVVSNSMMAGFRSSWTILTALACFNPLWPDLNFPRNRTYRHFET